MAAAIVMGRGLVLTSQVRSLWVGYLTYGLGVGLGGGLYLTPTFAVVGGWFQRNQAMALGVASAGSGMRTLLLVPTASRLITTLGWRTRLHRVGGCSIPAAGRRPATGAGAVLKYLNDCCRPSLCGSAIEIELPVKLSESPRWCPRSNRP